MCHSASSSPSVNSRRRSSALCATAGGPNRFGPRRHDRCFQLGEFLLPYEAVRTADDPDRVVARFLQTTYEAAAELGGWDRSALEDDPNRLPPLSMRRS